MIETLIVLMLAQELGAVLDTHDARQPQPIMAVEEIHSRMGAVLVPLSSTPSHASER